MTPAWPSPPWADDGAAPDAFAARRRERVLRLALEGEGYEALAGVTGELEAARRAAAAVESSAAYEVGTLVVGAGRRPIGAFRLPVDLVRLRRRRRAAAAARTQRARSAPPATPLPEALFYAFDAALPTASDRPCLAVVGPPGLADRLGAAAHARALRPMAAARGLVAGFDALVVAVSGGRRGPWFGLGTAAVPERDAALRELLDRAGALGVPAVLLVDGDLSVLPAMSAVLDRFTTVLGEPGALWDRGIDWRTEGPLGPRIAVDDLVLDADLLEDPPAPGDAIVAVAAGPVADHPWPRLLGARWVETGDGAVVGALVRGAVRILTGPSASPGARRLAETSGKAARLTGPVWPPGRPGPIESLSGRRAVRVAAGHEDVAARVAGIVRVLGGQPAATRPTVSVVRVEGDASGDRLLDALTGSDQVVEVISGSADAAARQARGDYLLRVGPWALDDEVVADVLAAACYADAATLTDEPVRGAVTELSSTSDALLVRRALVGPSAGPWSVDGVRVAALPAGAAP
jgi:hypothetical protein